MLKKTAVPPDPQGSDLAAKMTKICARYGWFPGSSSSSNASSWVDTWTELLEWTLKVDAQLHRSTEIVDVFGFTNLRFVKNQMGFGPKKGHPIPEDEHFALNSAGHCWALTIASSD